VFGRMDKPPLPKITAGGTEPPANARRPSRYIVMDERGLPRPPGGKGGGEGESCEVYDRSKLLTGNVIAGPAVIEEPASSTLLGPGDRAVVNEFGHLVIKMGGV
jgi:N-methylhydantoinase A